MVPRLGTREGSRACLARNDKWKAIALAVVVALCGVARAAELTGEVKVAGKKGNHPVFVYAEPLDGGAAVKPGRATMKQQNKALSPRVLVVPVGSTVEFPNLDPIFHNIFSKTKPGEFDLGLYRAGASKSVTFRHANTYRVFCNIHPQMTAVIQVVPTSYIAEADAGGKYRLEVPPGRYRVTAWSERAAQPASAEARAGERVAALTLDESKYVELPHTNKHGQEYGQGYDPMKK